MADILEYQASDAKAKFAELLDEVERGRTVRITRHGKTIARIVPEADVRAGEVAEAIERLKALRKEVWQGAARRSSGEPSRGPQILMAFVIDASIVAAFAFWRDGRPQEFDGDRRA